MRLAYLDGKMGELFRDRDGRKYEVRLVNDLFRCNCDEFKLSSGIACRHVRQVGNEQIYIENETIELAKIDFDEVRKYATAWMLTEEIRFNKTMKTRRCNEARDIKIYCHQCSATGTAKWTGTEYSCIVCDSSEIDLGDTENPIDILAEASRLKDDLTLEISDRHNAAIRAGICLELISDLVEVEL